MILKLLTLIYFISRSLRQWELYNVIFFISLKITVAVVEVEIKHLSIYLNRPAQATFIHVNTPCPVSCLDFSGLMLGSSAGRNLLLLLFIFLHIEEGKGKYGDSAGKRRGVKDRGQSSLCAVYRRLPSVLWRLPSTVLPTWTSHASRLRSWVNRGPLLSATSGLPGPDHSRAPLRHAPFHSVLSQRAPAPLRPAACSRTCSLSPGTVCVHLLPVTPVWVRPPADSSVWVSGPSHPRLYSAPSALWGGDSSP